MLSCPWYFIFLYLEDPQDAQVAAQYKSDINLYNETAKYWTDQYANPEKIVKNKMKDLLDMGFSEEDSKKALIKFNYDVEKSLNFLLGN